MKRLLLPLIIVLVVVGAWFYLKPLNQPQQVVNDTQENQEIPIEIEETAEEEVELSIQERILASNEALVGELEDVVGGDSFGTGYILVEDEVRMHYVTANLPDPTEGSSYEGWLVQQQPTLSFFSTGVMEKVEEGKYELVYSDSNGLPDYNFIVITEETIIDETPEVHIIEGVAK